MTTQQAELNRAIEKSGWEIVEIRDENLPWWVFSMWMIESRWSPLEVQLVVILVIDPMYERGAKQGYVERVVVTRDVPGPRLTDSVLAQMTMRHRWQEELPGFLEQLNMIRLEA